MNLPPFPFRSCIQLVLFFFAITTSAQTLSGEVQGKEKISLTDAFIYNLRSGDHTHTNPQGKFSIKASTGDSLQVSHLGYQTKIIRISSSDPIVVQLQEQLNLIDEIVIAPRINALNIFADINTEVNPVNSSQELLRKVPGLIIGQHAGGGKAEQIFLRGFDIDHGTDISLEVDGLPVNMVSHAHGQGYSDLHFLIPETLERVNFGKGPYTTDKGNFSTAGFVSFKTRDRLENSTIKAELGQFNTQRLLGMFDLLDSNRHSAYLASEFIATDGPFESPQNFNRINAMLKYSGQVSETDQITALASRFSSQWDASGQIPQRAVESGLLSRFGAIDDTEGGETSRTNFLLGHTRQLNEATSLSSKVFYSEYDFLLFSNFTFFLNDPINGDQIKQQEKRKIFGISSEYTSRFSGENLKGDLQLGISLRNDRSNGNELSRTLNRQQTLEHISLGDINETNVGLYAGTNLHLGKWTLNPGVRLDHFRFNYYDQLANEYQTLSEDKAILSPKFNILYNAHHNLQVFLKSGKSFHSNDTRVVVRQEGEEILPAAYGSDLGMIWKPWSNMVINSSLWYLFLEQEFVYVGDEGVVEPSGKTERKGVDFSMRYQPLNWLHFDLDATYTIARATEEPEEADHIPLAPDFTLSSGINVIYPSGFYSGAHLRHLDSRPANEDNSIVAEGYTVVDLNLGYKWKQWDLGLAVQNLFDTEWNETQFATETRLDFETEPVEEIHFTPGTPFFLKGIVSYSF